MVGSRDRPRRLASEQALELDEFESSAGVYSVQDGRIRSHGKSFLRKLVCFYFHSYNK